MKSDQYIAKPILSARDAIASHVRWKITLQTAATLRETLSARATRSIEHPDECSIREWLLSGRTLHLRDTPEHRLVLKRHADFHVEMLKIATLINARDFAAAERLLTTSAHFQEASNAVANAIMALDHLGSAPLHR